MVGGFFIGVLLLLFFLKLLVRPHLNIVALILGFAVGRLESCLFFEGGLTRITLFRCAADAFDDDFGVDCVSLKV